MFYVFILFLKSSVCIMRCDFKFSSCFSGVLGYPGLAVVGELGSDGAILPWFLLVIFLHLLFAFWLSLVLADVAVSWESLSCFVHFYVGTPVRPALLWLYLGM